MHVQPSDAAKGHSHLHGPCLITMKSCYKTMQKIYIYNDLATFKQFTIRSSHTHNHPWLEAAMCALWAAGWTHVKTFQFATRLH